MNIVRSLPRITRQFRFIKQELFYTTSPKYVQNLQYNGVSLQNYINELRKEYEEIKDKPLETRIMELKPIISILDERNTIVDNLNNLNELLNDPDKEIKRLAEEEKVEFEKKIDELDQGLLEALLPVEFEDSYNDIVLEVNMGVGGQEAMLFAKELFEMYCNFAVYKGWEVEIVEKALSDQGGIRHGSALISGKSVFRYFKHEAGVHRVQRIPVTEKAGRIHTSTVSVLALPQPSDIEINLNQKDLKIETKRSSGAGGQHVNTTDSCVRITHLPTGITVECQVDRSQIKNRKLAMTKLRTLLYQRQLDQQTSELEATRKSQVRSNFRNEKIRTYNFPQDRITDHRLQSSNMHNLEGFLRGNEALEVLIDKLDSQRKLEILLNHVDNVNKKANK